MQVQITGRHMDLSPALKERAEKEMSQFERYFENIVSCRLRFDEEKVGHSATLDVKVHGEVLTATAKGENAFAALELVTDKMKRRLKDYKTRIKERKRHATPTNEAVEQLRTPKSK
jgi:putative sigma-54 modulation protein